MGVTRGKRERLGTCVEIGRLRDAAMGFWHTLNYRLYNVSVWEEKRRGGG
jgi:hypothetical protein